MGKVIPLNEGVKYIGVDYSAAHRLNMRALKTIIDRLKLPENYKKEITKKVKKDQ